VLKMPLKKLKTGIDSILASGSTDNRRPVLGKGNESNVKGLYIVGDLAGAPVIKLAMAQGFEVIEHIAGLSDMLEREKQEGVLDVLVVGAGASGLNAALACRDKCFSCVVLEKGKMANTIENFPEGKWVYAEPDKTPPKGKLWLDGARKEELVSRWHQIVKDNQLDVRTEEGLTSLKKKAGVFEATTEKGNVFRARKIVLATGQRGNPRQLGVAGEDGEKVYHRLYSPRKYKGENIVVVGGGNSAVEAALVLSEQNDVTLSYRGTEIARIFKDNRDQLDAAVASGKVKLLLGSEVQEFGAKEIKLTTAAGDKSLPYHHAFVLIGAELPVKFLKGLGIRLENEWEGSPLMSLLHTAGMLVGLWFLGPALGGMVPSFFGLDLSVIPPAVGGVVAALSLAGLLFRGFRGDRYSWLGVSFLVWFTIYGVKVGKGTEFWPYRGWGYSLLSFFDRPWAFWYTILYTGLMTVFGIQALRRWGLQKKDKLQIWRFASLISFQWIFFFIVPEFLFQWAVKYQWVGETLANDPQFADQAWRSYGLVYAWPLFFYTFFYDPHIVWVVWGLFLTFVLIPIFVIFNGKRYCSWICGCGGLAETFGDRWRHLAAKGKTSVRWEWMSLAILLLAVAVTVVMLLKDMVTLFRGPADWGIHAYRVYVDVWLVGILPVTLYPFLGGKVWCRYWCPLAKMMGMLSKLYVKIGISRFHIVPNDKCIGCNECSRNCQVGIDVMQYALKQEVLDNSTSSCIGCGICVSVCPMDTLSYSRKEGAESH